MNESNEHNGYEENDQTAMKNGNRYFISASAGTGKTTRLLENVMSDLLERAQDNESKASIRNSLIITFTIAAAAELRSKLARNLDFAVGYAQSVIDGHEAEDPDPHHYIGGKDRPLVAQIKKHPRLAHRVFSKALGELPTTQISSIDALNKYIVDRNADALNIDPGYQIMAGEAEGAQLKDQLLADLFEQWYDPSWKDTVELRGRSYAVGNVDFLDLLENANGPAGDEKIGTEILRLYDRAQSKPNGLSWLDSLSEPYRCRFVGAKRLRGVNRMLDYRFDRWIDQYGPDVLHGTILEQLDAIRGADPRSAEELFDASMVFSPLFRALEDIASTYDHGGWDEMRGKIAGAVSLIQSFNVKKDGTPSKQFSPAKFALEDIAPNASGEAKKRAGEVVRRTWNALEELRKIFAYTASQTDALDMVAERRIDTLVALTKLFGKCYRQAKDDAGLAEFSDVTHLAVRALKLPGVMNRVRDQWQYIYVDECQDNNAIQNKIIDRLGQSIDGKPDAKVTMVGDIKQSIYGFRYAKPEEFNRQIEQVKQDAPSHVDGLKQNHRSDQEILIFVNTVFDRLMRNDMGGADYVRATPEGSESDDRFVIDKPKQDEDTHQQVPYNSGAVELLIRTKLDKNGKDNTGDTSRQDAHDIPRGSASQQQADMIARRIRRLVDRENYRYQDIAILSRNTKPFGDLYDALTNAHIPAEITGVGDYYRRPEIMIALDWLKIIDNPYEDVPLVAVLRAYGFTDNELAIMKLHGDALKAAKDKPVAEPDAQDADGTGAAAGDTTEDTGQDQSVTESFIELLRQIEECVSSSRTVNDSVPNDDPILRLESKTGDDLVKRCRSFLGKLDGFRRFASCHPVDELLWHVYANSGWYDYCGTLPDGRQRQGNLAQLCVKAHAFENAGEHGTRAFLRLVERWSQSGDRHINEEIPSLATKDSVHVMTIHQAKGLQWKVVILMGASSNPVNEQNRSMFEIISASDLDGRTATDGDLAFTACDLRDERHQVKVGTFQRDTLEDLARRKDIGEQLRLLYVALTRPEEKLIIAGTWNPGKHDDGMLPAANLDAFFRSASLTADGSVEPAYLQKGGNTSVEGNYLSWILSSLWAAERRTVAVGKNDTVNTLGYTVRTAENHGESAARPGDATVAGNGSTIIASKISDSGRTLQWELPLPAGLMGDTGTVSDLPGRAITVCNDAENVEMQPRSVDGVSRNVLKRAELPDTGNDSAQPNAKAERTPAVINASGVRRWLDSLPELAGTSGDDSSDNDSGNDTAQGNIDDKSGSSENGTYPLPDFLSDEHRRPSSAELGTAVHNVLELFDWSTSPDKKHCARELHRIIDHLAERGLISSAAARTIGEGWIFLDMLWFVIGDRVESEPDNRIFGHGGIRAHRDRLYREAPFSLLTTRGELKRLHIVGSTDEGTENQQRAEDHNHDGDEIVVRGVIDGYYVDDANKQIILFDYKTDKMHQDERNDGDAGLQRWMQRLHDDYCGQQALYAQALQQLYPGYTVAERWLIGLAGHRLIDVSDMPINGVATEPASAPMKDMTSAATKRQNHTVNPQVQMLVRTVFNWYAANELDLSDPSRFGSEPNEARLSPVKPEQTAATGLTHVQLTRRNGQGLRLYFGEPDHPRATVYLSGDSAGMFPNQPSAWTSDGQVPGKGLHGANMRGQAAELLVDEQHLHAIVDAWISAARSACDDTE